MILGSNHKLIAGYNPSRRKRHCQDWIEIGHGILPLIVVIAGIDDTAQCFQTDSHVIFQSTPVIVQSPRAGIRSLHPAHCSHVQVTTQWTELMFPSTPLPFTGDSYLIDHKPIQDVECYFVLIAEKT